MRSAPRLTKFLSPIVGRRRSTGIKKMMEPERLSQLLDEYAASLLLYARQWCAAPEDVVQEAFIKLAAQRPPPENIVAWLYRVVRNGALAALRAERRRRRHETNAAQQTANWFLPVEGARLDADLAASALQALPLEQRETLVAHLWGGLTFEQIGELSGVSSSTAHRRYLAGLSSLRERLGVSCPNDPKKGT
jgi:RNA polymerase sigma factor (sigma-70 family)